MKANGPGFWMVYFAPKAIDGKWSIECKNTQTGEITITQYEGEQEARDAYSDFISSLWTKKQ